MPDRSSGKRSEGPFRTHWVTNALRRLRGSLEQTAAQLRLRETRFHVFAATALASVVVWGSAWELLQRQVPILGTAQLGFHRVLSQLNPRASRVHWVTVVAVDDQSYYSDPFNGAQPTSRRALGRLVAEVARHQPILIALDFQLISPLGNPWADSASRAAENDELRAAIAAAAASHVPVVLGRSLVPIGHDEFQEQANVFSDEELPLGCRVGHLNIPSDPRQMSLTMRALAWNRASTKDFPSFAQQIVKTYEESTHAKRPTEEIGSVKAALNDGDFLYAGFFPVAEFDSVSAAEILRGRAEVSERCRHKIVLIGGTWHQRGGLGEPIERLDSPIGKVPGVYLHANYVEALNDGRFTRRLPHWLAIVIDIAAALWIYVVFLHRARRRRYVFALVGGLVFLTYVFATNIGFYVDFFPIVVLCLIHVSYEEFGESRRRPGAEKAAVTRGRLTRIWSTAAAASIVIVGVLFVRRHQPGSGRLGGVARLQPTASSSENPGGAYAWMPRGGDTPVDPLKKPEMMERVSGTRRVLMATGTIASLTDDEIVLSLPSPGDRKGRVAFSISAVTVKEGALHRAAEAVVEYHVENGSNIADHITAAPAPIVTGPVLAYDPPTNRVMD